MSNFSENVRRLRLANGFTQAELGKMINVSQVVIADYEREKITPKPTTFVKLAKALGTTCEEMIETGR